MWLVLVVFFRGLGLLRRGHGCGGESFLGFPATGCGRMQPAQEFTPSRERGAAFEGSLLRALLAGDEEDSTGKEDERNTSNGHEELAVRTREREGRHVRLRVLDR